MTVVVSALVVTVPEAAAVVAAMRAAALRAFFSPLLSFLGTCLIVVSCELLCTAGGLLFAPALLLPIASEGRHAIVGAFVAKHGQIGVELLDRPLLLARLPCLLSQHMRQLVRVRVQPHKSDDDASNSSCRSSLDCSSRDQYVVGT